MITGLVLYQACLSLQRRIDHLKNGAQKDLKYNGEKTVSSCHSLWRQRLQHLARCGKAVESWCARWGVESDS